MNLRVGQTVFIVNTATRQRASLEILDLYSYKGQAVVYGERHRYDVWVPSQFGHQIPPAGPACFPIMLAETAATVTALVAELRSFPLFLVVDDDTRLPILSLQDGHLIFGGTRYGKEDMIARSRQLIDLYLTWRNSGMRRLPIWFQEKQAAAKTRSS